MTGASAGTSWRAGSGRSPDRAQAPAARGARAPTSRCSPGGRRLLLLVLLAYGATAGWVILHHEPWRDEADAWLLARDASLPDLYALTGHMGTPSLWYLLLMPLAKLGLPYATLHAVHLGLAWTAAGLLLWKAPFPWPSRLLIAFSYPLAYEYAVVARNYALGNALLFGVAALWPRRFDRPRLFAATVLLLANASVHMLAVAGAVGAVYAFDVWRARRASRATVEALAILVAGGAFATAQLVPLGPTQIPTWTTVRHPQAHAKVLRTMFGPPAAAADLEAWVGGEPAVSGRTPWQPSRGSRIAAGVSAATLGGLALWLLGRPRAAALFALAGAGFSYIFFFKWIGDFRHAGLVLVLLVFCAWIARAEERAGGAPASGPWFGRAQRLGGVVGIVALHVGLLLSVASGWQAARWDLRHEYSHARQVAAYLEARRLLDQDLASSFWGEAALVYLPIRQLWYADREAYGSHNTWDARYFQGARQPMEVLAQNANRRFPDRSRLWLLLHRRLEHAERWGYRLVFRTRGPVGPSRERFFLYRALPLPKSPGAPADAPRGG